MDAILEESVTALCGPKGRHDPDRIAVRHGHEDGSVALGGRKVPVRRPRVRSADGSGEVAIPAYEHFSSTEVLGRLALEKMLAKLSTRRYSLRPRARREHGRGHDRRASPRSAVSRRFVERDRDTRSPSCSPAISPSSTSSRSWSTASTSRITSASSRWGSTSTGIKHPLGVVEGDTENATVVKDLLVGLRDRGLDMTRPMLVVIDGAKALAHSGERGLRPPGDRSVSTPQDPKCRGQAAEGPGRDGGEEDARDLSLRRRASSRGRARGPRPPAAEEPPRGGREPSRGTHRDAHGDAPEGPADARPHAALDERDRVDDRDLPGPLDAT